VPLYTTLKYIHVLSVAAAFGTNITYVLWFTRARKNPEALPFTLQTIKIIDDWIATPAYVLLLPSGWWLASLAGWSLTTPWILTSLILYAAVSIIGLGNYTPTLKKQIAVAEALGPDAPEYKRLFFRLNTTGTALNLLGLVIIYLMVAKPALWS
jgi:uncharacterized membrane protein